MPAVTDRLSSLWHPYPKGHWSASRAGGQSSAERVIDFRLRQFMHTRSEKQWNARLESQISQKSTAQVGPDLAVCRPIMERVQRQDGLLVRRARPETMVVGIPATGTVWSYKIQSTHDPMCRGLTRMAGRNLNLSCLQFLKSRKPGSWAAYSLKVRFENARYLQAFAPRCD